MQRNGNSAECGIRLNNELSDELSKGTNRLVQVAVAASLLLAAVMMPGVAQAAGDPAKGKAKAMVCTSCHGANGKATIPAYPHLAGQNAGYLELSIKAYRDGARRGGQADIMKGMATSLTDEDIAHLAAYFSSLK